MIRRKNVVDLDTRKRSAPMKFWRPGITGKLFVAIFRHLYRAAGHHALGRAGQFRTGFY